jgi:hypothetical protein
MTVGVLLERLESEDLDGLRSAVLLFCHTQFAENFCELDLP